MDGDAGMNWVQKDYEKDSEEQYDQSTIYTSMKFSTINKIDWKLNILKREQKQRQISQLVPKRKCPAIVSITMSYTLAINRF